MGSYAEGVPERGAVGTGPASARGLGVDEREGLGGLEVQEGQRLPGGGSPKSGSTGVETAR